MGILLSLGSLRFFFKRRFLSSGLALFVSLILMVITRHQLRVLRLQGHFGPASWRITPQWFPFLLFLVCFASAAILIVYMMRLFFSSHPDSP